MRNAGWVTPERRKWVTLWAPPKDCWDNAVAESFFSTLEFEGPATRSWRDAHDAELSLPGFLDDWYNDERLHSYNGQASPSAKEARWQLNRLAA